MSEQHSRLEDLGQTIQSLLFRLRRTERQEIFRPLCVAYAAGVMMG